MRSLYDVDWISGRAIEVFYVDGDWAREFGGSAGWYWWECWLPDSYAYGPFPTAYRAYRDALISIA